MIRSIIFNLILEKDDEKFFKYFKLNYFIHTFVLYLVDDLIPVKQIHEN